MSFWERDIPPWQIIFGGSPATTTSPAIDMAEMIAEMCGEANLTGRQCQDIMEHRPAPKTKHDLELIVGDYFYGWYQCMASSSAYNAKLCARDLADPGARSEGAQAAQDFAADAAAYYYQHRSDP
jgi:hypothetical protein